MVKDYVIVEGDTYESALQKGITALNVSEEQVTVEVLEGKKRSLFFGKKTVKLKVSLIEQDDFINEDEIEADVVSNYFDFDIDYRPDGVYLTIKKDKDVNIEEVTQYLEIRNVRDYQIDKIINAIRDKNGLSQKIASYHEEEAIDSILDIKISKDKYECSIMVTTPYGGNTLTVDEIINALNDKGIIYGIDRDIIQKVIKDKIYEQYITVAFGTPPKNGRDGEVHYFFARENDSTLLVEENGRVDFKNLNKIRNVKEGDLLLEITPPTQGAKGINIYGEEISAKNGKHPLVKKGKNIKESEDGLRFYASKDGEVHFLENRVYVDEILEIPANVDPSTGNINFNGKVFVKGNVKSGFSINAEGDIEVMGVVESADLLAKGDIILHRGVQGNNQAFLQCDGSLKSKYIENAKIRCLGNIEADFILHSDIQAKEKIILNGKKGLIVGGETRAGKEVRAKTIGTHMGTITKIEVGIDPDEKGFSEKLKQEIGELEKNLLNLRKTIDLLNKMKNTGQLSKNKQDMLVKSVKTYEVLKNKHANLSSQLNHFIERLQHSTKGKVHASMAIHNGVRISISNTTKYIHDELASCTLYVKDGEITVGPYER